MVAHLLEEMIEQEASDLHLAASAPPFFRVAGRLAPLAGELLTEAALRVWLGEQNVLARLEQERTGVDFALSFAGRRLRGHAYFAGGLPAVALRLLPEKIPSLADIGAPPGLLRLSEARHGLVLVSGQTGAGKTTTLAALLGEMAAREPLHVVTLEDPIEYLFQTGQSLFQQRELGRDFASFAGGTRAALRENPDVLLIAELRDTASVRAALMAAASGLLVLATLHAGRAADVPLRVADFFPQEEKLSARAALAAGMAGIVAQKLVTERAKRRAVFEILLPTPAVRRMIHDGDDRQLPSAMLMGQREGMTTFEQGEGFGLRA